MERQLRPGLSVVLRILRAIAVALNPRPLHQGYQPPGLVRGADTAGDVAVLGQRIAELIACHRNMQLAVRLRAGQVFRQETVALLSVIIVGIADHKRLVDDSVAAEHRMSGSPRLGTAGRHGKALGNRVQLLVYIGNRDMLGQMVADIPLEQLLYGLFDHKHRASEPGGQSIVNRKFKQSLSVRSDRVHLF